jgi:hypothetical protein
MPRDAAELLRDALSLPAEARAALADSLLESLDVEVDDNARKRFGARRFTAVFSRSTAEPSG